MILSTSVLVSNFPQYKVSGCFFVFSGSFFFCFFFYIKNQGEMSNKRNREEGKGRERAGCISNSNK